MTNRMPPSNIQESSALPRKRARRSSPPRVSRSPSPEPDIATLDQPRHGFPYLAGMSNRQRVDIVLSRMYGEHRWTIKDLIYHMVMEEAEKSYTASTKKRARDISKAIFDVPEVVNALRDASDHLRDHQILDMANIFEKELRAFTGEPGLGEFNAET